MTIKFLPLRINIIKKDEIALAALLLVIIFVINMLYIRKYYGVNWPIISGYDQFLQSTITSWEQSKYLNPNSMTLYSHPGFGLLMAPLYAINNLLSYLTGCNCANFLLSFTLIIMFIIETILLKRILNEYIGLNIYQSLILSFFFSGMAYVLLMSFTPDHFAFSQFFLILYVYLWTKNQRDNRKRLDIATLCIGCITITNGIKIILSKLLFEKEHLIKFLFLNTIVLISMILISIVVARNTAYPTNSDKLAYHKHKYETSGNYEHHYTYKIKTIYWSYKKWIKADASRVNGIINNMFGQSILFHSNSLNQDNVSMGYYPELWKNIMNVLIIVMVACGMVLSIKTKLMQLLLCFLSVDIFIHIICCFGISEIYIYSPHYLFIFVISIGYLIRHTYGVIKGSIITIMMLMTFLIYLHNISEIIKYLI